MAYEMPITLEPYVCMECACLFLARTVACQASTTSPCPVCGTNNGNIRAGKSPSEVARELDVLYFDPVQEKHDAHEKTLERHGGADEYFDSVLERQSEDELDIGCADELTGEYEVPPELEMCYAGEE